MSFFWPTCIETEWYCRVMWFLMGLIDSGAVGFGIIATLVWLLVVVPLWKTLVR